MLLAPRYSGLELPRYEAGTEVVDGEDLYRLKRSSAAKVLRTAALRADVFRGALSVGEILKRADEELEAVAELCGTRVVGHTWGMLHDPDNLHPSYHSTPKKLLPAKHIFVAEVDVIKGARKLTGQRAAAVESKVNEYYYQGGVRLDDIGARQFIRDFDTEEEYLVDIEPRFAKFKTV